MLHFRRHILSSSTPLHALLVLLCSSFFFFRLLSSSFFLFLPLLSSTFFFFVLLFSSFFFSHSYIFLILPIYTRFCSELFIHPKITSLLPNIFVDGELWYFIVIIIIIIINFIPKLTIAIIGLEEANFRLRLCWPINQSSLPGIS